MLVGLLGIAGSGKGTVSDILVDEYGWKKESFADPVKDAISAIFGWPRHLLEGDTQESRKFRETVDHFWSNKFGHDVTPRWAMQKMGTEAGRDTFHPDLWIISLEKKLAANKNTVIADVRFQNECDMIRSNGGIIVRVRRGPTPPFELKMTQAYQREGMNAAKKFMQENWPGVHISEWESLLINCHYTLHNVADITNLREYVRHIVTNYLAIRDVT